jgi:hypothetical protein
MSACDGVLSPDAITGGGQGTTAASGAPVTPIDTSGVSCPSDAPQLRVGSLGLRMDIDFSEIKGAISYEIQIERFGVRNIYEPFAHLDVTAPAKRAEWYGKSGRYLVRIRTKNCGGFGNWSADVEHALAEDVAPPPPPPPQAPPPPPPPSTPKNPKCTGKKC